MLYGLPLQLWNTECFTKVATAFGSFIAMDRETEMLSRVSYAILGECSAEQGNKWI